MAKPDIEAEFSSGNPFEDVGFEKAEAVEKLLKSKLAHKIASVIKARGLKQAEAAEIMGINQPKVSALLKGSLSGFSLERLIRFLAALDVETDITFKEKPKKVGRPSRNTPGEPYLLFLDVEMWLNNNIHRNLSPSEAIKTAIKDIVTHAGSKESYGNYLMKIPKADYSVDMDPDTDYYKPLKASTLETRYRNFINTAENQAFITAARKHGIRNLDDMAYFVMELFKPVEDSDLSTLLI